MFILSREALFAVTSSLTAVQNVSVQIAGTDVH